MPEPKNKDRTPIIVAIIGLVGVLLASTIPLFKDSISKLFSQSGSISTFDKIVPVKIGDQTWMQENLNVGHFNGGEVIPEAKNEKQWQDYANKHEPCWCYRKYSSYYSKVGKFYNFYAVNDVLLKLAPVGWHIPSKVEWQRLIAFLNIGSSRDMAGIKMKSSTGWKGGNVGNNNSNFTAIATGLCGNEGGFLDPGIKAEWWSASSCCNGSGGFAVELVNTSDGVSIKEASMAAGFNVRCIKD